MTKHANLPADRDDATTVLAELSETELANVTGGTSGAGAGKVTFNSFTITKVVDKASPNFFM